jgi:hypothetical protein
MSKLPSRLHHTAYCDQGSSRRRALLRGHPRAAADATWCEKDFLFGKDRTYCHCFFGIGDGGALAFFQFADPDDQAQFGPEIPATPFIHLALNVDQADPGRARRADQGRGSEATYTLEHGYCRSVYVVDPNGHDGRVHLRRSARLGGDA